MAAYKTLKGQSIRRVAQDPTNAQLGEIWYNTTLGVLKGKQYVAGVFISGGNMNTSRGATGSSTLGTQTASLVFGGESGGGNKNLTEAYNGTTWSEVADLNTTRKNLMGAGTQTAALGFGGYTNPGGFTDVTEEWNGTSWTNGNAMNRAKDSAGKVGTQTAALSVAGRGTPGVTTLSDVEEYNGTNWSEVTDTPVIMTQPQAFGIQTAAVTAGGSSPPSSPRYNPAITFEYDGTNWTGGGNINNPRGLGGTAGTQTAGVIMGGYQAPPDAVQTNVEDYDGTSFSNAPTLSTARTGNGCGGSTAGLAITFGGALPAFTATTEERVDSVTSNREITTS